MSSAAEDPKNQEKMAASALVVLTALLTCLTWIMATEGKHLHSRQRRQTHGNCLTASGAAGICKSFHKCIVNSNSHLSGRPSICGWEVDGPIICCPVEDKNLKSCGMSEPPHSSTRVQRQTSFEGNDDATNSGQDPFVIGGKDALLGQWPWMGLIYHEDDKLRNSPICGASLISNSVLLTAAHCFLGRLTPTFVIRLGEHNLTNQETRKRAVEIKIKKIISHPGFQYPALYDDIAVLHLESQVSLNKVVNTVCLPEGFKNDTFVNKKVTITGWGSLEYGGRRADILQEVELPIVPNSQCQKRYDSLRGSEINLPKGVTQKLLCAGIENEAKDSCQGDSGGPLVFKGPTQNWFQVGIVSAGFECGTGIPGLYTRVTEYLDWISKNMA